jgi:hypothetical protein
VIGHPIHRRAIRVLVLKMTVKAIARRHNLSYYQKPADFTV